MAECFGRESRLLKPEEFSAVFKLGSRFNTRHFVAYALPRASGPSRLGVAVGRKVGRAVKRNRIKRLVREIFRRHRDELREPCDVVVVARAPRDSDDLPDHAACEKELRRVFRLRAA